MTSGENVLWIVRKTFFRNGATAGTYIFRTRFAASTFTKTKNKKAVKYFYSAPDRATWGPEQ